MVQLEEIARAAIDGDALGVRSLVQEWLPQHPRLSQVSQPKSGEATVLVVAAALVELFALRREEPPPPWTAEIGALEEPLFLLRHAASMPRLRRMCELESPEPLRRRRIFAPSNYLVAA